MSDAIILSVEGIEFRAESKEDEPRVLDVVVGERAGVSRPRDVRRVIERGIADGSFRENEHFVAARAVAARGQGNRVAPVTYWLTEAGAIKLITRLRTPAADAMVDSMIRVYREAIRQLREPERAAALAPATTAEEWMRRMPPFQRVGDNPVWCGEFKQRIGYVSFFQGVSWRKAEGWLRRSLGVISYKRIPAIQIEEARRLLLIASSSEVVIARRVLALPPDTRQRKLFEN